MKTTVLLSLFVWAGSPAFADDSAKLAAILAPVGEPGGMVRIPPGDYELDGAKPLPIPSHTTVSAYGARFHLPKKLGDAGPGQGLKEVSAHPADASGQDRRPRDQVEARHGRGDECRVDLPVKAAFSDADFKDEGWDRRLVSELADNPVRVATVQVDSA